ncbi:MAG: deoxyhypusine synthase family protein [Planctomycetes bacterium]|nr:deoxyhypusine synthase family protein [Planctomycetota bacterium]
MSDPVRKQTCFHDGHQDGLVPLHPLDLAKCHTVDDLVRAMAHTAFGGRQVGEGADVLEAMIRDPGCGVVMTLSGAMTIAKQGLVITEMIERGMVQAIVSTGALVAHGMVEGAGLTHFKVDPKRSDEDNYRDGYNRVYDTYELESNLDDCEAALRAVLTEIETDDVLCSSRIHELIGHWLLRERPEGRGILQAAIKHEVPVFAPAFSDSELGLDLALYNRQRVNEGLPRYQYDPYLDLERFVATVCPYERRGIFTIGGGVPRNWAQELGPYVELLAQRDLIQKPSLAQYSYAVRICPEPVHWGGLSGCTYREGVSWGKFLPPAQGGRYAEVPADATIAWPLIAKAVMERLDADPAPPKLAVKRLPHDELWTGAPEQFALGEDS